MKIALICHPHHRIAEPWAGGMEMHSGMIARALARRGHAVTMFAKEGSDAIDGVELVPIETEAHRYVLNAHGGDGARQAAWSGAAIERACEMIGRTDPDLVLNNSLSALPHRRLADRRLITVMHCPVPVPSFVDYFAEVDVLPARHRFATVSESNAEQWRPHARDVEVLPNGVDTDFWGQAPQDVAARARDDDHIGDPTALWTGRITHQKGLHLALEAAAIAGIPLRFSGQMSDPGYFTERIEPYLTSAAGSDPVATHLGHLSHEEIRRELASAAVFVASPLWAEPFGLAPVEAMASGTPVAATPRGAMPEVIREGGVVAESVAPEALAAAMREAARIDRAAARHNASRYSADAMAERYEALARSIT